MDEVVSVSFGPYIVDFRFDGEAWWQCSVWHEAVGDITKGCLTRHTYVRRLAGARTPIEARRNALRIVIWLLMMDAYNAQAEAEAAQSELDAIS